MYLKNGYQESGMMDEYVHVSQFTALTLLNALCGEYQTGCLDY